MKLSKNRVGLVAGSLYGGWHLLWSLLVLLGIAGPLADFATSMHSLVSTSVVGEFTLNSAALLVVATFAVGYAAGWIFAWVWNALHPLVTSSTREYELED